MSPNEKSQHGDREAGKRDKLITKYILAREVRNQLADHTHGREDHDVDRRMRVKQEQMLEQDRIAAGCRIEDADVREPLKGNQQNGNSYHGRAEYHDQAGRTMVPDKQ